MKCLGKMTACVLLSGTVTAHAGFYGNTAHSRVQELMDWNRDHPGEMPPLTEQEKYEFFTKKGMPIPGTGATVVNSPKGLHMTKAQSSAVAKFNADQKKRLL